jgi:hypothetical protein
MKVPVNTIKSFKIDFIVYKFVVYQ